MCKRVANLVAEPVSAELQTKLSVAAWLDPMVEDSLRERTDRALKKALGGGSDLSLLRNPVPSLEIDTPETVSETTRWPDCNGWTDNQECNQDSSNGYCITRACDITRYCQPH